MNLFSDNSFKIHSQPKKNERFSGWTKCSGCHEIIHQSDLNKNLQCCFKCGFHYRLDLEKRIELLADHSTFRELFTSIKPVDFLGFTDLQSYESRLIDSFNKTGRTDAICTGICLLEEKAVALAVMDFSFMGGSMGCVVGEKLTLLIELATEEKIPLIIVSASGGARMQESVLSLMQMAKVSAALANLASAKVPYISVLTNPTTGGVTASFATLGDIIIAEPDALIAFTGPRVIEQTIRQKLPENAQKSTFMLEKGMVDCVVKRSELKKKISQFIDYLSAFNVIKNIDTLAQKMPKRLKELLIKAEDLRV